MNRARVSLSSALTRSARGAGVVLIAVTAFIASAGVAHADTTLAQAAASLRSEDPVFVAPEADPTMTSAEADQLRARIRDSRHPFFVAVLPASALVKNDASATLQALHAAVGLAGTYAVVVGPSFRGGDTKVSVSDLATAAFRAHSSEGVFAVLDSFVVEASARLSGTIPAAGSAGSTSDSGSGSTVALLAGVVVVGGGGLLLYRRAKRKVAGQTAAVRATVDEDVTSYGEVVAALNVDDPRLDEAGRADAQRALDAYESAKASADQMARPEDAQRVTTALEDGRYALACVQARIAGDAVPDRRPPCFVDPRHGPSTEDVQWAPDGGAPRPVPVCAACSTTLASGQMPDAREVTVGGARVPYWQGGRAYAPYAGGYYAASGMNMMSMLFMGSMLGGMFSGPQYGGGMGGAGESGGGGFSGGDFGGGGGDFGGGDF